MGHAGNDIAPSTRGSTLGSENAPIRASNLLSRISGFFESTRKPLASTSARPSREDQYRHAPERKDKSAPVAPTPGSHVAESSHFHESLGPNTHSPLGENEVQEAFEASITPIGAGLETPEIPTYRALARNGRTIPAEGIGTRAFPSL